MKKNIIIRNILMEIKDKQVILEKIPWDKQNYQIIRWILDRIKDMIDII